jgi:hypothetical protein
VLVHFAYLAVAHAFAALRLLPMIEYTRALELQQWQGRHAERSRKPGRSG